MLNRSVRRTSVFFADASALTQLNSICHDTLPLREKNADDDDELVCQIAYLSISMHTQMTQIT